MIILCDSPKREYDSAQTVVSFSKFHYSVTSRHDTTRLVAACVRRDEPSLHVTSDNMRLVHWPLMDGLLHLVQRRRDWAEPQFAQPNVTARPSAASLPITVLSYDGPRVKIKGKLKVKLGLGLYSYYYVIHVKFQQNDLILNSIT